MADGNLGELNAEESWALLEDLALYDNESWNDPRDFAKPVKAITLPQDVPSTSDRRLIELENQVQRLMEAHLALTQPTQVNKITTSCKICSGPHDTQYCMEDPEQAFVEYASSLTDEAGEGLVSNFMASQDARVSKFEADFKQQQSEMTNKINTVLKAITDRIAGALPSCVTWLFNIISAILNFPVEIVVKVIEQLMAWSGMDLKMAKTYYHSHYQRIDYGFVSTVDAEARRQGISKVRYGIRDTWVDLAEAVPKIAPTTLGEVSTRVAELAELHEHDTQDLYALLEDAQDDRTRIS
ncbi:hypothetical protein Tco_0184491 [Tanacetum coccineum]